MRRACPGCWPWNRGSRPGLHCLIDFGQTGPGRRSYSRQQAADVSAAGNQRWAILGRKSCSMDDKRLTGAQYAVLRDAVSRRGPDGESRGVGGRPREDQRRPAGGDVGTEGKSCAYPDPTTYHSHHQGEVGWPVGGQAQVLRRGVSTRPRRHGMAGSVRKTRIPTIRMPQGAMESVGTLRPRAVLVSMYGGGESCARGDDSSGSLGLAGESGRGCLDVALSIVGEQGGRAASMAPFSGGLGDLRDRGCSGSRVGCSFPWSGSWSRRAPAFWGRDVDVWHKISGIRGSRSSGFSVRLQASADRVQLRVGWRGRRGGRQCGLFGHSTRPHLG